MSSGSDDSRTHELTPVLSPRWALGWRHFALVAFFGLVFLGLSYRPLSDARVWLAALQGRVTLDLRAVPDTDAAQPLTDGMPMIAVDWLSQVALALAETWGGPAWISNLMSLMGLACCVILARVFFLQTRRTARATASRTRGSSTVISRAVRSSSTPTTLALYMVHLVPPSVLRVTYSTVRQMIPPQNALRNSMPRHAPLTAITGAKQP